MWTDVGRLVLLQLFLTELLCAEGKTLFRGGGRASPPQRETRRGIGVCRRSALVRRAGWVFTHGSHLDRGARAARGSNAVRRWQSGWREVCCRTRVQIQVGVKGENDLVEGSQGAAQLSVFAAAVSDSKSQPCLKEPDLAESPDLNDRRRSQAQQKEV